MKLYCDYSKHPNQEPADHKCDICGRLLCKICGYIDRNGTDLCNECYQENSKLTYHFRKIPYDFKRNKRIIISPPHK